jgi:biopolymer transport protein ExbD
MAYRRKKRSILEPDNFNLTPLIDCVFLLLVFFMVTTVFKNPAKLKLTLPIVSNPMELDKRQLIAELDDGGNIALNSRTVGLESFDAYLQTEKQNLGINSLLIKADEKAKHGDVIKLMVLARGVGIETIAMAVDTPKEDEE